MFKIPVSKPTKDKDNISFIEITENMVALATNQLNHLETIEDILFLVFCFICFGRMYQEWTIDAAKTGMSIVISYAKRIRDKIKLMSRLPLSLRINWKNNEIVSKVPEQKEGWSAVSPTKNMYFVEDEFHKLRMNAFKVVESLADEFLNVKIEFSAPLLDYIEKRRTNPVFKAACDEARFIKNNFYGPLMTAQEVELDAVYQEYGHDRKELKEREGEVRGIYRERFALVGDKLRKAITNIGSTTGIPFSSSDIALAALETCFFDESGSRVEARKASTFADNILGEEFAMLMAKKVKQKGDKVYEYTEDAIAECTFEEGVVADFVLGEAFYAKRTSEYGDEEVFHGYALAKDNAPLEGKFLIGRDEKGHLVAKRSIFDVLKAPEADKTKEIVVTAGVPKGTFNIDNLLKEAETNPVSFVQYRRVNGEDLREAIVCNGTAYARYRNYKYRGADKKLRQAFDNIGSNVTGDLLETIPITYSVEGEDGRTTEFEAAILVLENVRKSGYVTIRDNATTINASISVPAAKEAKKEEEFLLAGDEVDW